VTRNVSALVKQLKPLVEQFKQQLATDIA